MKKNKTSRMKRLVSILAIVVILISMSMVFQTNVYGVTTIDVQDGTIADWKGISAINDPYIDVNGAGPNDLIKVYITSDNNNLYCRWDVLLTGNKVKVTSSAYSLAISSIPYTGITRPAVECRAYVGFNSQGNVSSVAIGNASKTIQLPLTYAEQVGTLSAKTRVSIEAKFPYSSFNSNSMTQYPINTLSVFPMWGESLASASFSSAVKDNGPETGYLSYDSSTNSWVAIGTGPLGNITGTTDTPKVVPGATVYYTLVVKNVGDSTGNPNLLFNSVRWVLPTGFTYISGSTSGLLTTANPTGSTGTLTWNVSGSLAPGATTTIQFRATASSTAGTYFSDVILNATTPVANYDLGDVAAVEVNAIYVPPAIPLNLTASGTTQTTTNLSWSASTGAVSYILYDNGLEVATGITGTSYTVTGLTAGSTHNYTIRAVSSTGAESGLSNTANVTTVSPYSVTVNNSTTNDNTPTVSGTTSAPNGSVISVVINGSTYTGTVSSGLWTVNVSGTLSDGSYAVSATVSGAVSNTGTGTIVIDTAAPTITVDALTTSDNTPAITGTTNAADGSTVTLVINGKTYTGTANAGAYSIAVTNALADGSYTASAGVSDAAGNTGTNSAAVIIDTTGPALTVNNLVTNNTTPTITGTTDAPNGSTATLVLNGHNYTGTVVNGTYSIVVTSALPGDGTYTSGVTVTDALGNTTEKTGSVIVDTVAPTISVNGQTTNDNTPAITGTTNAADGSNVTIVINGQTYSGSASGGAYSITVTNSLPDGVFFVSASVTDEAGNTGTDNAWVYIDTVAPEIMLHNLATNDTTPLLIGDTNMEDGSIVTLTINGKTYTGTVNGGSFSISITNALPDGSYTANLSVTDNAGNTGSCTGSVVIDTAAPEITVDDLITNESMPSITGTTDAPNGSIITLIIDNHSYTGTANNGNYSIPVTNALMDGTYTASIRTTDAAGNTGTDTSTIIVDTVSPSITVNAKNTNDSTPTVTGTTDAADGSTVTLVLDGHTYTGTVNGGSYSIAVTNALDDGSFTVSVSVTDAAGNTGTDTASIVIDTSAPSITVSDIVSNDNTPHILGTTDAPDGCTVTIVVFGNTYTGTVSDGTYNIVVLDVLPDNLYVTTAYISDMAGNTNSSTGTLVVDTLAPEITVDPIDSNDNTPLITGTTDALDGTIVSAVIDGHTYTGTVSDGAYSIAVTNTLADGSYTVSVSVTDSAGNTGTSDGPVVIDTIAPTISIGAITTSDCTPTINGATDAEDGNTVTLVINGKTYYGLVDGGAFSIEVTDTLSDDSYTASASVTDAAGNTGTDTQTIVIISCYPIITINNIITNDITPTITGTTNVEDDSVVTIVINGQTYTGLVSGGAFSISVTSALDDGIYEVTASATCMLGNTGTGSGTVDIDTVDPVVTVEGLVTSDTTPVIRGTTDAFDGTTVSLVINGKTYTGTASLGLFSIEITDALPEDSYTAVASVTDAAGNTGTGNGSVVIDITDPAITVNTLSTNNNMPFVSGTSDAADGSVVTIFIIGETYTGTVNGGTWSIQIDDILADGPYDATASVTDAAGNTGTGSGTVTVDTLAPVITVTDIVTNDTTPVITGTTDAADGSIVTLVIFGNTYTGTVSDGTFSISVTDALPDNLYVAAVSVEDSAGNTGTGSGTVVIDTAAPAVSVDALLTNSETPFISGTTDAADGSTVTIVINGQTYTGTIYNGLWSVYVTDTLDEGSYDVTASVTDAAGNTGSGSKTIVVDMTAPAIAVDPMLTKNNMPVITGTTDAADGSTISILIINETYTGTAQDGKWSIQIDDVLPDGAYHVDASVTDTAGNFAIAYGLVVVDTVAPCIMVDETVTKNNMPVITGITDAPDDSIVSILINNKTYTGTVKDGAWSIQVDDALNNGSYNVTVSVTDLAGNTGSDSGAIVIDTVDPIVTVDDMITNEDYPILTGTADVPDGTVIILVIDEYYSGIVFDSTWHIQIDKDLPDGEYSITAYLTDPAGNTGTGIGTLVIDKTAPVIMFEDMTTNNNMPTIAGTTDAANGSTVTLSINGETYTGIVSNGAWSIKIDDILPDGSYDVTASVTDSAGNTGTESGTVVVDTTAPSITVDALTTKDNTPVITGTTEAADGSTVTLVINGASYTGTVSSGTYSITVTSALPDNSYTASVSVSDSVGNVSTGDNTVVIDTVVPEITVNNIATNNNNTIYTGTTDAADGSTITIEVNGWSGTGTASGGAFSIPFAVGLPDGTYTINVSVIDAAGNTGTNTGTVFVDTIAPIITVNDLTTSHNTPTITGTTDVADGSIVTLVINGKTYTGAASSGTFSIDVTDALPDDSYTVSVTVSDAAGNIGENSGTINIGLDETLPPDSPPDTGPIGNEENMIPFMMLFLMSVILLACAWTVIIKRKRLEH